jgi:selenophosphate synthase
VTTPPIPPDTAAPGQSGHITAHNQISDVLTAMAAQLGGLPVMSWGTATLVSGTVTVTLGGVASGSVILTARMAPSGTLGHLSVAAVTPGSGFTVTSSSAGDNSVVAWLVLG